MAHSFGIGPRELLMNTTLSSRIPKRIPKDPQVKVFTPFYTQSKLKFLNNLLYRALFEQFHCKG